MTNSALFIELLHRLENYDDAVLLTVLLTLGADKVPIRATLGQFRQSYLGGALTPNRVAAAVGRLQNEGLLTMEMPAVRMRRSRYGELALDRAAVLALLRQPMVYSRYTPGLSTEPIPLLKDTLGSQALRPHILDEDDEADLRASLLQGVLAGRSRSPLG